MGEGEEREREQGKFCREGRDKGSSTTIFFHQGLYILNSLEVEGGMGWGERKRAGKILPGR